MFELNGFVNRNIIKRNKSMFYDDIKNNEICLSEKIFQKSILVIGGAGSIGSSFIKAVLPYKPKSLVVVDINENALAELTRDLRSQNIFSLPEDYVTYPMDYSSRVFSKMFEKRKGFDIVANFSAHKHVRSEKDIFSIEALIDNNLLNAKKLLELLKQYPPEEYFCVSTDKAANPTNIMGASKRIMEDLIFSYSEYFSVKTARFANVAFSNGSLLAGFLDRIKKLQPLSAPVDIKRYFVSLEESGQICMLACFLGKNREIFFPKLDNAQMMTFDKIATQLLVENGYEVLQCESDEEAIEKSKLLLNGGLKYPVHYSVSDTSGEKSFEEFYTETEKVNLDKFASLGIVEEKEIPDCLKIKKLLYELERAFESEDLSKKHIVEIIGCYLPSFQHIETGKTLDQKM